MFKQNQLLILVLLLSVTGCATEGGFKLPGVYRVDIQQGNVIDQETVNRLRPGMDKNQVQFIMGTPAIHDPFHAEQWDYLYTLSERGGPREQRRVRIYFEDGTLARVEGDMVPAPVDDTATLRQSRTVEVPIEHGERGFFKRIFN